MSDTPARVEPPPHEAGRVWHWMLDDEGLPFVAAWVGGGWQYAGVSGTRTPEQIASLHWRYIAPCIPPEAT